MVFAMMRAMTNASNQGLAITGAIASRACTVISLKLGGSPGALLDRTVLAIERDDCGREGPPS